MEIEFIDFYTAYNFLETHPMVIEEDGKFKINHFKDCLDISVVKINPETNEIDNNFLLNTKIEVWLEFGGWCKEDNSRYHDIDLDCGGDTFEKAIINLANLVINKYGEHSSEPIIEKEEVVELTEEELEKLLNNLYGDEEE